MSICSSAIAALSHPRRTFPRGTVGCFVRLRETGQEAILTNSFAVGAPGGANRGDRILNPPGSNEPANVIAKLHSWIPLTPAGGSEQNTADGAALVFVSGISGEPKFDARLNAPPALRTPREPRSGERGFKVGAISKVTWGVVEARLVSFHVAASKGQSYEFKDMFSIQGEGRTAFMYPGDAGAIVVGEDGALLGLVFAGSARIGIACPIRVVLDRLGCDLLLPASPTTPHGPQPLAPDSAGGATPA
jgi:hypothetical protein